MGNVLDRSDYVGLAANIGLALGATVTLNGLVFGLGWTLGQGIHPRPWFEPPGWVIGLVWTCLIALLAAARWRMNGLAAAGYARLMVLLLAVSCLLYPFYALATQSSLGALFGVIWTGAFGAYVLLQVGRQSGIAAWLVSPLLAWDLFAAVLTLWHVGAIGS